MTLSSLNDALRWQAVWAHAMDAYADMCTNALVDDNLDCARRFAKRYEASKKRFWNAFAREMVAKYSETPSRVDWFGEGHTDSGS